MKNPETVEGRRVVAGLVPVLLSVLLLSSPRGGAVAVDAELVLLVDITQSVSDTEFDQILEGYAVGFESGAVLNAIQSGLTGSIAASLVFYTQGNDQAVGVDWMEISDAASAQAFADAIRNLSSNRPFDKKKTSIAGALDFAVDHFGAETGGAANGFESSYQGISFAGEGIDDNSKKTGGSRETTVQIARDAAVTSGVDVINAVTIGTAGSVDDYFVQNVVGGGVGGNAPQVDNVTDFSQFQAAAIPNLEATILSIIPEPGALVLLGGALFPFALRRRRSQSAFKPLMNQSP